MKKHPGDLALDENGDIKFIGVSAESIAAVSDHAAKLFEGISKSYGVPLEYLYGTKAGEKNADHFFETIKEVTDELFEKHKKKMGKLSKLVEAKAKKLELALYGTGTSSSVGVRTPYNAGFVAALKMEIPPKDRHWDGDAKEWVVDAKHLGSLQIMIKDYYGQEPILTKESPKTVLADKSATVLHVTDQWIEIQTPYDQNFLTDFKEYFDEKKWMSAVKRWKVPYSKENLNMASYLIRRHYGKVPEIQKA